MKKLVMILMILAVTTANAQTVVVDNESGKPLGGILVFSTNGVYIDMTDSLGHLPVDARSLNGVILQSISHKALTAKLPADTIRMQPTVVNLEEVKLTQKADYIKLRGFYREYFVANDTMVKYEDGMADYFIPINGGKAKSKLLMSRQGKPGYTPLDYDNSSVGFSSIDLKKQTTMDQIREQQRADMRDTLSYIRTDTTKGITTAYLDELATRKNHRFTVNLLVLKIQITNCETVALYEYDGKPESQTKLISFCNHTRWWDKSRMLRKAQAKGKMLMGEVSEDDFSEFYVTERTIVSKEQMKAELKNKEPEDVECVIPESVPMLSEKLLQKLEVLKKLTKRHWEGRNIVVPTANSK